MQSSRKGFSLVIVLVLTSTLLLTAAAFTDALLQAARSARLGWQGERATHAADAAILRALSAWNSTTASALRAGESDTLTVANQTNEETTVVRTRLQARLYTIAASARVLDGGLRPSRRAAGRTLRLEWPIIPAHATLTVLGPLNVRQHVAILGADSHPALWEAECEADARASPSVAINAAQAAVDADAIVSGAGQPVHIIADSAIANISHMLDEAISRLSSAATLITNDSILSTDDVSAGAPQCPVLFGDARRSAVASEECTRRWPVVLASHSGTVQLTGNTPAQGVLVVNGDLHVEPGVTFAGLLIVRGKLTVNAPAHSQAVQLIGATIVRSLTGDQSELSGNVLVQTSQCAARLALAAAGVPRPVAQLGWSERH